MENKPLSLDLPSSAKTRNVQRGGEKRCESWAVGEIIVRLMISELALSDVNPRNPRNYSDSLADAAV
jgi:hypothetical protein